MGTCSSKSSEKPDSIKSQNKEIDFQYIDGRRFHNVENAVYPMPNDDDETDRLHFRHFLTRYIWQSNFSAPIKHILDSQETKILDVGEVNSPTWFSLVGFDQVLVCSPVLRLSHLIKICFRYPMVDIIGIDISQQPPTHIKPDNFTFIKANALKGLPFKDNTFDYVFQRNLLGAFTEQNWSQVINELVRVLKPGGFIELMEHSMLYNMGPATKRLCDAEIEAMKLRGTDPFTSQKLDKYLQNQGKLEAIKKEIRECHHGAKSNQAELNLSRTAISNLVNLYAAWKPRLAKIMQISSEEYDKLAKISEKELFEYDTYFNLVRVYAKKVDDDSDEIIS
ncbi:14920_t:CDS:2 [Gigaspora margarita]|uniref:14920_t:CDS:1 n=1 Tax=Gigaspora margarita TaxID=4874 RepID=A0ABM8W797_GIGMA|nr:14920_t:CDS:2 [Gigaspora margarita]